MLTVITITMFILSTAHIALLASSLLRHINRGLIDDALEFRDPAFPESSIQIVLECINVRTRTTGLDFDFLTPHGKVHIWR